MRLLHTDPLLLRIHDEDRIRNLLHVLDAAEVFLKLLPFLLELDHFLLRKNVKRSVLRHRLDRFQSLDPAPDRLEVCEHAAQPSLIDIEHVAALRLCAHCVLRLLLRADEKNRAALRRNVRYSLVSLVNFSY